MKKSKAKKPAKAKPKPRPKKIKTRRKPGLAAPEPAAPKAAVTSGPIPLQPSEPMSKGQVVKVDSGALVPDTMGGVPLAVIETPGKIEKMAPLQRYLMEARRYPILTREQEVELAKSAKETGDAGAAERLVISNLRLVVKIAIEYQRHWTELFDLVQEGNIGLLQAVKKFDPYRGIRFSTYASFWIRAYILKFLMENYRLVKIGKTQAQRRLFFNLKKEKERLENLGFKPTASLLAENLLTSESEVDEMQIRMAGPEESMDSPISEDGKQTLASTLADENPGVMERLSEAEFKNLITAKLTEFRKNLTAEKNEKELYILDRRLLSENPETLQEVGKKFKISRERVRQIETRVLKRLKEYLKKELPDFEDFDFLTN
jgi:RNA polymerase sigma-32 factor